MKYFDSHCHPYVSDFDADRDEVLSRMEGQGVGGIVVGTDLAESRAAVELAEKYDFLWASVGLHPTDNVIEPIDVSIYRELAQNPKVVAIGECGLDYYRLPSEALAKEGGETNDEKKKFQKSRFESQLKLSIEVNKPLIIHCRPSPGTTDAHDDMLTILSDAAERHGVLRPDSNTPCLQPPPVIHFFTSTKAVALKYLELGCYVSLPGVITFADLDEVVRAVPLDRILSETDSPYAAPTPFRGKRNEPAYVEEVIKKIA